VRRSRVVAAIVAAWLVATLLVLFTVAGGAAGAARAAGDDRSPGEVRDRAREVLSRDEFKDQTTVLQRVLDWIGDHLPSPPTASEAGKGGSGLVGDLVLLAVAAALVYALIRVARSIRRQPPKVRPDEAVLDIEERRSARSWRREAEELESAARWREAMLARYRELVTELIDAHILADVPGRTSGEYRLEHAEVRPARAHEFAEATDLFERAWYGGEPTGAEENRRFRALAAQVIDGADERVDA
jgi:hypothetical protein